MSAPSDPGRAAKVEKKAIRRRREQLAARFMEALIVHHGISNSPTHRGIQIKKAIQAADDFIEEFNK